MTSSEDEDLECAIWGAMAQFRVTCPDANLFVDALLFAAKKYAAGDSPELTAHRRYVLYRDTEPTGQTSPGSAEAPADRTGTRPLEGSAALGQPVAGGGATSSTGASIPRRSDDEP